ncbi:hypothetical protein CG08_1788 [Riemerella anatipestifer]|uniref:Uncharacterized protein n=1 Tax=Riemerella anatipestifer RA-CH-1 TaxID=1228997 RepID=J9QSQ4_RIEAN|nr:hypothetical protein B739_0279 [Riemerella anatipestifer RA-CH-1]AIH01892.1 hypothetical protein M949_0721 [Riemerella anatipestifer CH3]AKP69924.1 hypothetical protein CG08_1788 [Riemerella anatipestifer]MDD1551639.1 hypothetical protein [Riemerella anatipestifer]MDD1552481.1 hypothetical protein [Riemerella anatipestifer]
MSLVGRTTAFSFFIRIIDHEDSFLFYSQAALSPKTCTFPKKIYRASPSPTLKPAARVGLSAITPRHSPRTMPTLCGCGVAAPIPYALPAPIIPPKPTFQTSIPYRYHNAQSPTKLATPKPISFHRGAKFFPSASRKISIGLA